MNFHRTFQYLSILNTLSLMTWYHFFLLINNKAQLNVLGPDMNVTLIISLCYIFGYFIGNAAFIWIYQKYFASFLLNKHVEIPSEICFMYIKMNEISIIYLYKHNQIVHLKYLLNRISWINILEIMSN